MSMMDNILGMGRYGSVNESWEPELQYDDFDSIEPLGEGVDPMEFMMESIFNNELNMRNLDTAIMCEEYTYLRENGTEMVYEAGTISNIIEKAKNAITKIWEDIQKFIKNQVENFTKKSEKDFLRKYKTKAVRRNVRVKGFDNLLRSELGPNNIVNSCKAVMRHFDTAAVTVTNLSRGKNDDNRVDYVDTDDLNTEVDINITDLPGIKSNAKFDISDFSGVLNDALSDLREGIELNTYSSDTAISYYETLSDARKLLRPQYESSRKNINTYLKTLKKMESAARKFKILPTETSTEIHKAVRTVNKLGSCTAALNRYCLKLLNMCKAQYKAIIVTAAAQYNKKLDKDNAGAASAPTDDTSATAESFIESVQII